MTKTLEKVREKVYAVRTQIEAHRKGLHGSWGDWAQEIVQDLSTAIAEIDRISAQAKVRVTDEDVDLAKQAARLSQGAQGEAVAEVDELDCETGPGVPCITMLGPMPPIGTKLYTHPAERDHEMGVPSGDDGGQLFVHGSKEALQRVQWYIGQAERAAVPDEVLRKAESLRNGIHAASCRMPEGWADVAVDWQRDAQAILDWLTAVPQPPEGARVVDGWQPIESAPTDGTPHVRGLWVRTPRGSYFDAVVGGLNDEGEFVDTDHDSTRWDASDYTHWHRLSAAPTLAGKEG